MFCCVGNAQVQLITLNIGLFLLAVYQSCAC